MVRAEQAGRGGGRDREEAARFAAWNEKRVPTPEPRMNEPRPEPAAAPAPVVAHPAIDLAADDDEKEEGEKMGEEMGEEDPGRDAAKDVERNRQAEDDLPKTSPPKGTPPGRVRKRRAVYIPDSDDDPTQSGAVPSLPSQRPPAPGPVPVASKTAPSPAPSRGPPPEWATNLARSPPFTYIAAFTLLQRRTGPRPAGVAFNGVAVTLHCRCAAVGALEIAADPSGGGKIFRLEVTLDDAPAPCAASSRTSASFACSGERPHRPAVPRRPRSRRRTPRIRRVGWSGFDVFYSPFAAERCCG